jgi:hypothetical protein
MRSTRLTPVEVDDEGLLGSVQEPVAPPPSDRAASALTGLLVTSLRALSLRAVVALANLFMAASAASAWWLWYVTLPNPSIAQLVGLTLYGCFILALNFMMRRR